jgi:hypothetical protein
LAREAERFLGREASDSFRASRSTTSSAERSAPHPGMKFCSMNTSAHALSRLEVETPQAG